MGGFAAAIALEIAVEQEGYMQPIYSQFVFIGVMGIAFFIIPETPCEQTTAFTPNMRSNKLQGST